MLFAFKTAGETRRRNGRDSAGIFMRALLKDENLIPREYYTEIADKTEAITTHVSR
jgi:hypothetical protein